MDAHAKPETAAIPHGGDISRAEAQYGPHPQGWLDLSTGINPNPYPIGDIDAQAYSRLPLKKSIDDLRQAAMDYYGAPSPDNIVAAPGTQALIQWLPRLRGPSRVAVVGPTYAEHARSWRSCGHTVSEIADLEQADGSFDVVVAVNPNNPDGRRHAPETLLDLHRRLATTGGCLVVDEAFADMTPGLSLSSHCRADGLIVLKSYGKFFGLAGLRLGFALTGAAFGGRLTEALGPWAFSEPAAIIAAKSFRDGEWIARTRKNLIEGRQRLEALLGDHGLDTVGGTGLFTLAQSARAPDLHAHLASHGIWTRVFPENPAWIRFGHPGKAPDWGRLSEAFGRW